MFYSESEIDVIPRSSLFQRTGLRRSTSQVEPERHRRGFRQNCEEAAAQESDERDSRVRTLFIIMVDLYSKIQITFRRAYIPGGVWPYFLQILIRFMVNVDIEIKPVLLLADRTNSPPSKKRFLFNLNLLFIAKHV